MRIFLAVLLLSVPPATDTTTFEPKDVLTVGAGVSEPIAEFSPSPAYPPEARRERIEGDVLLEAVIRKNGLVGYCKVSRSVDSHLDAAAIEAVNRWRYRPALLKGRPVPVYLTVTVHFALPDAPQPRAASSLLGIWKIRGVREWIVASSSGQAFRCVVVTGGPTLASPGTVTGSQVVWKRHWAPQTLLRTAQQLVATERGTEVVYEATEIPPAESCLPSRFH
jgi:TonB family protein